MAPPEHSPKWPAPMTLFSRPAGDLESRAPRATKLSQASPSSQPLAGSQANARATRSALCPPPRALTCELPDLLGEGALGWVLVLGRWARQVALELLLFLENTKKERPKQQDPHKTKTRVRTDRSTPYVCYSQMRSRGHNARGSIWGIFNKLCETEGWGRSKEQ